MCEYINIVPQIIKAGPEIVSKDVCDPVSFDVVRGTALVLKCRNIFLSTIRCTTVLKVHIMLQ